MSQTDSLVVILQQSKIKDSLVSILQHTTTLVPVPRSHSSTIGSVSTEHKIVTKSDTKTHLVKLVGKQSAERRRLQVVSQLMHTQAMG